MSERIREINAEIAEIEEMITYSIMTNDRENLNMWRRALQTAKREKRKEKWC